MTMIGHAKLLFDRFMPVLFPPRENLLLKGKLLHDSLSVCWGLVQCDSNIEIETLQKDE